MSDGEDDDEIARRMGADLGIPGTEKVPINRGSTAYRGPTSYSGPGRSRWDNDWLDPDRKVTVYDDDEPRRRARPVYEQGDMFGSPKGPRHNKGGYKPGRYGGAPFDDDLSVVGGAAKVDGGGGSHRWATQFLKGCDVAVSDVVMDGSTAELTRESLDDVADEMHRLLGDAMEAAGFIWKSDMSLEMKKSMRLWVRGLMWKRGGQTLPIVEVE